MISLVFRVVLCVAFTSCAVVAGDPAVEDGERASAAVENCFSVPSVLNMNVLSDQHLYVQTRGGNHYLVATGLCKNLQDSYLHDAAHLVPYGRTVCQNDGSYLLYETAGRELPCPILTIDRVHDKAEAKSLADRNSALLDVEVVTPAK